MLKIVSWLLVGIQTVLVISFVLMPLFSNLTEQMRSTAASASTATTDLTESSIDVNYTVDTRDMLRQAASVIDSDRSAASLLLQQAIQTNPADPYGPLTVGLFLETSQHQDAENSSQAIDLAFSLAPADAPVIRQVGDFWERHNNAPAAIKSWTSALQQNDELGPTLFPKLWQLLQHPANETLFAGFAKQPPTWWGPFFGYVSKQPDSSLHLAKMYNSRKSSEAPLTRGEKRLYLRHLRDNQLWEVAYLSWLETLSEDALSYLGLVYNGGFETLLDGGMFRWQLIDRPGATIRTGRTPGIRGNRALEVNFHGQSIRFADVFQYLQLNFANYSLTGRAQLRRLKGETAVFWSVRCANPEQTLLARTEPFEGTQDWYTFQLVFAVDDSCKGQILRLETDLSRRGKALLSGNIWFDDLSISRLESTTEDVIGQAAQGAVK